MLVRPSSCVSVCVARAAAKDPSAFCRSRRQQSSDGIEQLQPVLNCCEAKLLQFLVRQAQKYRWLDAHVACRQQQGVGGFFSDRQPRGFTRLENPLRLPDNRLSRE